MIKKILFLVLFLTTSLLSFGETCDKSNTIDLSGIWRFQTDPMGFGKTPGSQLFKRTLTESIMLPGSMDESGKGLKNVVAHVDRLSRKFEYCGMAWYQRDILIPECWKDKEIVLTLERCHWETEIYIDGTPVGKDERLSSPNRFLVSKQLTPGVHVLTICVDNRLKYPMDQWNHGTTEYTQTNWNGIVGEMTLTANDKMHIDKVNVYPNIDEAKIDVKVKMTQIEGDKRKLTLRVKDAKGKVVNTRTLALAPSQEEISCAISIGKGMKLWDEFNPYLYTIDASIDGKNVVTTTFGMRKVEQGKHHIRLNNRNIHLRGVLDCAVFPLTGYPSTDPADWVKIFNTIKDYGFNHVRFHSWCPPQAAFIAGDQVGMYLQAELPMWIKDVGKYPLRRDFFEKEMYALLDEYGNHPSFVLYCNGNENQGDFDVLEDLVIKAQKYDDRRLYSASTARTHVPADQYYTSHVTPKGRITVYEGKPNTEWDQRVNSDIDVPVIAHESGQRCMFPNFEEIKKYTGVLEARNFKLYQEALEKNGMLHQADEFFKATGAHTVLQYKEVNEALLRTPNSGGYQLLGLADFPGQGSAFIGLLDAFWEDKGLVTPEKYRESNGPTVLISRMPKRVYSNDESFISLIEVYHYDEKDIKTRKLNWSLVAENGVVIKKGSTKIPVIQVASLDTLTSLSIPLTTVTTPTRLTLKVSIPGVVRNEWDIWVYPKQGLELKADGVEFVTKWDENTKNLLKAGKNVCLIPEVPLGRKARFTSHFWNPIMFRWKPMIVGTLIQDDHSVFTSFPTTDYADWQWWDILNHSTAMEMTHLRNITPIIQSVDTYEFNEKLGIAFEANVGKGKLFVMNVNVEKDIDDRLATKQLISSLKEYLASEKFVPQERLQFFELDRLFHDPKAVIEDRGDDEATKQLSNK